MNKRVPINLEIWAVRFIALLTMVMGLVNLTSAVQPALADRLAKLTPLLPFWVIHGSRFTSAISGFALMVLAGSLWRRKRTAWVVVLGLTLVSLISHLLKGLDFEEATLSTVLIVLLLVFHNSFHADSDRPSIRQGIRILVSAIGFTIVYATLGFLLLDKHFSVKFDLLSALRQTLVMFTSFYNPGLEPLTGFGRYFASSIYLIGFFSLAIALFMLIRPVLIHEAASPEQRKRALSIVENYGRTALAHATLFDDKSYFFGSEDTLIAFVKAGRGVMVLGDPIGPDEHIPEAIQQFIEFCKGNDWSPSFVSTMPDYLEAYRAIGFETLAIGYEAIIHLNDFNLEGSKNKGFRNSKSHMEREGYRTEIHQPPLDDALLAKLADISDAWLIDRKGGEMHFSDGWFNSETLKQERVAVVYNPQNQPVAFVDLVTEYRKNETTIDLMRHYPHTEHGTMEFLFVNILDWAKSSGFDTFSLGLSAVVGVGEKHGDPKLEQIIHSLSEYFSRYFNFKGLHQFKEKFHPDWQPRYWVYPSLAELPLAFDTLIRVHSGKIPLSELFGKRH